MCSAHDFRDGGADVLGPRLQVGQEVVQHAAFLGLRQAGRVTVLVEIGLEHKGSVARLLVGVGAHGGEVVVRAAPSLVACCVCGGGGGDVGVGGGAFKGVIELFISLFECGHGVGEGGGSGFLGR